MKTRLSLICIAITMLLSVSIANAQHFGRLGSGIGAQQSAFQAVQGDLLKPGLPGRLWFEANFADEGLGYNGSYLSIGGKTRLFQDRFDGRWLLEGQANQSIEDDGGFFSNIGIERVFSIEPANADISLGFFYDYDGDDQQSFSDGFHQLGVTAAIKSRYVDLISNGYFPINTDAYTLGDPTGQQNFVRNNIALQAGIENALQGFDVTLRTRPKQLAFANGYVDFGGYHYDSESNLVDSFAGGRLRVGVQLVNSLQLAAEVNQDERFDTTGALSVSWTFGNNNSGYGSEYAGLARDLEQTSRNDHIVRFSQDLIVAINPLTGQPYDVTHVNNATLASGDGTIESPLRTLAEAEAASAVNDIIFVDAGDGTTYEGGITLKDNQQLLSSGGNQFIQNSDGTLVALSQGGTGATISNPGGNEVVLLANNNTIGGINIDASGATFGVLGTSISGGTFNDTAISGATLDGIGLQNVSGNFNFNRNAITDNMQDGVFVDGSVGSDAVFNFVNNIVDGNGFEGIHFDNYEAASIILTANQTNNNGRQGVYLENALDPNGDGTDILLSSHIANANGGDGVLIEDGTGSLLVQGGTFSNNSAAGLSIINWRTDMTGDSISIAALEDGTQPTFTGNTLGINLNLDSGLTSTLNINDAVVDGNVRGVVATADGNGTVLNLNVGGTTTANNNANEAVAHLATNGATINSVIEGSAAAPLAFTGNSSEGTPTLNYTLDGVDPNNRSTINALVRNVNVNAVGGFALGVDGTGESVIDLLAEDSTLQSTGTAVDIALDNNINGEVNQTYFDNVNLFGNVGLNGASQAGTLWDLSLTNSTVQGNGAVGTPNGNNGIFILADGGGAPGAISNDNLTRVNLVGNTITDFVFDGIVLNTTGDAQMLAVLRANQILRNGAGLDDDGDNSGGTDDGIPEIGGIDPTLGQFFDGLDVVANDNSTISLEILNNTFLNNFQRSVDFTTNGNGTINANLTGNRFTGDIGADGSLFSFDFFIGEIGVQNFGGQVNLDISSNTFSAQPLELFGGGSPAVSIGLDGLTNGFVAADVNGIFTPTAFGLADVLIDAETTVFEASGGFTSSDH